jgi:hypothetical protein
MHGQTGGKFSTGEQSKAPVEREPRSVHWRFNTHRNETQPSFVELILFMKNAVTTITVRFGRLSSHDRRSRRHRRSTKVQFPSAAGNRLVRKEGQ